MTAPPPPSTAVLSQALRDGLAREGDHRRVVHLARRPYRFATSCPLEEITARLDDGTTIPILCKDLRPGALLPPARTTKPAFVLDPGREVAVYRHVLGPRVPEAAHCYAARDDPAAGGAWLLLEHVPGVELWQVGALSVWEDVAAWLADVHRRLGPLADAGRTAVPLLRHDGRYYRRWLQRAQAAAPAERRRGLDWLASAFPDLLERFESLPTTLIHGELYPSNVLVERTTTGTRVCPVDWEMTGVGPGLLDLAALTLGSWSDDERERIALAYRERLTRIDGQAPPRAEFLQHLDLCRLLLGIQWLGWAPGWAAPTEHAHDWWDETMTLARRLRT